MTPATEYREIPLGNGHVALVNSSDFDWLTQWKWHAKWAKSTKSFYAARVEHRDGNYPLTIRMHRFILGLHLGDKGFGDHINRNTLDNRRANLRVATRQENNINQGIRHDNTSGVRGVYWSKREGKWKAQINIDGKQKHLGTFPSIDDAAAAYRSAESQHYGGLRIDTIMEAVG